jgi:hypothetical protein
VEIVAATRQHGCRSDDIPDWRVLMYPLRRRRTPTC